MPPLDLKKDVEKGEEVRKSLSKLSRGKTQDAHHKSHAVVDDV